MCVLWWTSSAEDLVKARPHSTQANGRSLFAVHSRVLRKVGALAEVRPLACVHSPVLGEGRTLTEALAAVGVRI